MRHWHHAADRARAAGELGPGPAVSSSPGPPGPAPVQVARDRAGPAAASESVVSLTEAASEPAGARRGTVTVLVTQSRSAGAAGWPGLAGARPGWPSGWGACRAGAGHSLPRSHESP